MNAVPCSAIVIGAGISGMTSALVLARHGCAVTLVEQAPRPGVTLRGFFRKGVYFESGLHYVGELSEHGILRTYLRYLGLGALPLADYDPGHFETFCFADGSTFAAPIGFAAYREALREAFPREREGIDAFLAEIRAAYAASPFHTFSASSAFSGDKVERWQVPLEQVLNGLIADPRLRLILSAPGWLYGVAPDQAPFLLHARVAGSHFDSVKTFAGGGLALVRAFESRLREEGVTVLCGNGVSRILLSSASEPTGVELDNGERVAGKCVIHTAHPSRLPAMLPEGALRPAYRNRLHRLRDTMSAHLLFFSAKECPELLRGKNALVYPGEESFGEAFTPGRPLSRGPFYVLSGPNSREDEEEGPRARAITAVTFSHGEEYRLFYGTARGGRPGEYAVLKKERLEGIAHALARACPAISGLTLLDGATPLTLRDWLVTPQAGMYGAAHTVSQHTPLPVTRVPKVYLAGQGITAPGIMGAVISAFLACGVIIGHEALLREVRLCR